LAFRTLSEAEGDLLLLGRYWLKSEFLLGQSKAVVCASEATFCLKGAKAVTKEVWQV